MLKVAKTCAEKKAMGPIKTETNIYSERSRTTVIGKIPHAATMDDALSFAAPLEEAEVGEDGHGDLAPHPARVVDTVRDLTLDEVELDGIDLKSKWT